MNGSCNRRRPRPAVRGCGGQAGFSAPQQCQRLHAAGPATLSGEEHVSLCETLDRVLNKGVVIGGEIVISVAGIDLVYLGLQAILTSVETAKQLRAETFHVGCGTPQPRRERSTAPLGVCASRVIAGREGE